MTQEQSKKNRLDAADDLFKQGRIEEAIGHLEQMLKLSPDDESIMLRLAWCFWDSGDTDRAVAYWEMLLERELGRRVFTGFAYDELVRICKQTRQTQKLLDICQRAVEVQPDDVGLLSELGNAWMMAGQPLCACEVFRKLIDLESDNPVYFRRLGEALMASGELSQGEDAFLAARAFDCDESPHDYHLLADLYLKYGHYQQAQHWLEMGLKADPQNSFYHCALGDVFAAMKRFEEAQSAYEEACHADPDHAAGFWHRLGQTMMKHRQFQNAADAFAKAVRLNPSPPSESALNLALQKAAQSAATEVSSALKTR